MAQYNSLYYELQKRHPEWTHEQLKRAAYWQYYQRKDAEDAQKRAEKNQMIAGLGAPVAGAAGTTAGMLLVNELAKEAPKVAAEEGAKIAAQEAATTAAQEGATVAATEGGSLAAAAAGYVPYIAALIAANKIYERGGKEVFTGQGKSEDYANVGIDLLTGTLGNTISTALTGQSLGRKWFGKSLEEQKRDMMREKLKELGIAEEMEGVGTVVKLPNGEYLKINTQDMKGPDGQTYKDIGGNNLANYEIDWGGQYLDPEQIKQAGESVGMLNPLVSALMQYDDQMSNQTAGWLTNAALKADDPTEYIKGVYQQSGLTKDQLFDSINTAASENKIDSWEQLAQQNAVNSAMDPNYKNDRPGWIDPAHRESYIAHQQMLAKQAGLDPASLQYLDENGYQIQHPYMQPGYKA